MARTQAELAEIVGYSRVTVSKALSGHPSVQPATRERILRTAREVGYRPNAAARQMRSGRFHTAALLTSAKVSHGYMPCTLYCGLQKGLAERDLMMTVTDVADVDPLAHDAHPRMIREMSADGLFIDFCSAADDDVRRLVERMPLPAVWLNLKQDHDAAYIDDVDGGRKATEYLLEAGHTRIGFLGTTGSKRHYSVADRYAGYAEAMTAAGHTPVDLVPAEQDIGDAQRFARSRRVLGGEDRPTAIVAYERCEVNIISVLAAELGLQLGRDLSVVAISDDLYGYYEKPITRMNIPFERLGRRAVDALVERIDAPDQPFDSVAVPYDSIVEGETVGPPA